jgi:hypothetical protein
VKMFLRGRPVPMLIPDELAPTYSLDTRSELPSCRFKLDWVYPLALILAPPILCALAPEVLVEGLQQEEGTQDWTETGASQASVAKGKEHRGSGECRHRVQDRQHELLPFTAVMSFCKVFFRCLSHFYLWAISMELSS